MRSYMGTCKLTNTVLLDRQATMTTGHGGLAARPKGDGFVVPQCCWTQQDSATQHAMMKLDCMHDSCCILCVYSNTPKPYTPTNH
jgi:hypothetical protein